MRGPLIRALQLAVAGGLMAVLWQVADGPAALRHLAAADPWWLVAALVALTGQTVLSALRWRLTAAQLGIAITPRRALAEYYLSQIINQALPGGVLGDAGRALRARAQAGLMASGQAVVFERLAGQAALMVLFAAAAAGTLAWPGGFVWPEWLITPVMVALGAVGIVALAASWLPGRAGRALRGFGAAFARAVLAPEVRARQVLFSLGTAGLNIAAFACCAAAMGAPMTPGAAMVLVPLILFTMLVPLTISGWGLREGAAAVLLPLAGASPAAALAASVAFGLAVLVAALPGLAALIALPAAGEARLPAAAPGPYPPDAVTPPIRTLP